jgi:hypothetical protein
VALTLHQLGALTFVAGIVLAGAAFEAARRRPQQFLGRLFAGEAGVIMMTDIRGASNSKAKAQLGWALQYPSWREDSPRELACLPD